ncbi:hypothetical protein P775_03365 [Puniceibacterium antarcticum]|uniref:Lipoprotein n=1 Tax=Puniceibacterium antarcticum TaxID=1206336 RepID=A0A2G8RJG3_9RHOB|nr:hypothetical protein [Puniceibacterium antarcticum]PIL21714.1 hypothetical protein P775_03365 [Puniceibacterium antarcticum]
MRCLLILPLLTIVACNTAGPGFRGIAPVRQEVDGSRFLLRVNGTLVEVIRTSPEAFPRFETVAQKAGLAAHDLTGCIPHWIRGDAAMMVIGLSCNGSPPPPKPRRSARFSCDVFDTYAAPARTIRDLQLDCYAN